MKQSRGQWASSLGFILAASGSAVGLGNIWKFPGKVAAHGGGAFVLCYILIVVLVGFPVMLAEISIGRSTQKSLSQIESALDLFGGHRCSDPVCDPVLLLHCGRLGAQIHSSLSHRRAIRSRRDGV